MDSCDRGAIHGTTEAVARRGKSRSKIRAFGVIPVRSRMRLVIALCIYRPLDWSLVIHSTFGFSHSTLLLSIHLVFSDRKIARLSRVLHDLAGDQLVRGREDGKMIAPLD